MLAATIVVLGCAIAAVLLSWRYFRRYAIVRPPLGVFNFSDVAMMLGSIILIPYLDLALPLWVVAGLLVVGGLSTLYFTWEPILRPSWARWLATLVLVGLDLVVWQWLGKSSPWWYAINNVFVVLCAVGITNLWAQAGMKARDAAILAGALAIYDLVFTSLLPLMGDLYTRLAMLPLAPMVAWPIDNAGQWYAIGLGDLLLAAAFPLVMRKAFGRSAGPAAMLIGLIAIGALLVSPLLGLYIEIFPAMVVLGPLMVLQYAYWRRRRGTERTTWQYLQAEPIHR
jgi:hypothetical protein